MHTFSSPDCFWHFHLNISIQYCVCNYHKIRCIIGLHLENSNRFDSMKKEYSNVANGHSQGDYSFLVLASKQKETNSVYVKHAYMV